jgi:hypothetical protein
MKNPAESRACFARPTGKRSWGTLIFLSLSSVTASCAFVAVEFGGWVTGSDMGFRTGARVTGYFAYESGGPSGLQTSSRPNFVFEIPEAQFRFERTAYDFFAYNNWVLPGETVMRDALGLQFSYPSGYGAFSLASSNTGLFTDNQLPATIPALEQFDAGQTLYVILDQVQPYRATRVQIDRLSVVPGSGLGRPLIFGVQHTEAGLGFRFLTEPSTSYSVEVTANLTGTNWLTLTNVNPTTEPIFILHDAPTGLEKRFYRVRKKAE